MELSLIRSLMDKEFYDEHRGARCPNRLFSKDGGASCQRRTKNRRIIYRRIGHRFPPSQLPSGGVAAPAWPGGESDVASVEPE